MKALRTTAQPLVASDCSPRDRRGRVHGDDGAALMEFALVLPILMTVVLGALDAGRAFALKTRLTNMAREGAFYAQFHPNEVSCDPAPSISSIAGREDAQMSGTTVTVIAVTNNGTTVISGCNGTPAPIGARRRVRVTKPMELLTPFIGAVTGTHVDIRGEIEVVVQG
jgi:Flp pilus assembly protein TadG